jgi:pantetheine-phosphate adenylyltransferase
MPRVAVYTGTFDPVHLGHLDIIERGCRVFDRLVVAVGINPDKSPLLTVDERVSLLREVTAPFGNVEVMPFSGLAVHFVREINATCMLRGLRTTSDMEYEFTMSLANMTLDSEIETVFLMAKDIYSHLSSSLLKQIASFGGDLAKVLPVPALELVRTKMGPRPGKKT